MKHLGKYQIAVIIEAIINLISDVIVSKTF